jgi:hypothetical protein
MATNKRRIIVSDNEFQLLLQARQAKKPRKRATQCIEPDYDNMSLTEFGGRVQGTADELMALGIGSGFNAARSFDQGRYVEGTVETCKAVAGTAGVVMIIAQLLGAAMGRD